MRLVRGASEATVDGPKLPPSCPTEPAWQHLLPGKANVTLRADCGRIWEALVPDLDRHGILARVDELLVVDTCICAGRIRQIERQLARDGLSVVTERGVVKHPLTAVVAAYRTQLRAYLGELGLSPSSRSRLPWDVKDNDDFDLFSGPRTTGDRMVAIPPGSPMGWTPPV
jgi:P27 family predicted phage terminase small subunit